MQETICEPRAGGPFLLVVIRRHRPRLFGTHSLGVFPGGTRPASRVNAATRGRAFTSVWHDDRTCNEKRARPVPEFCRAGRATE
jgi:hypothetical protein